jgi:hypothetical protein
VCRFSFLWEKQPVLCGVDQVLRSRLKAHCEYSVLRELIVQRLPGPVSTVATQNPHCRLTEYRVCLHWAAIRVYLLYPKQR